MLIRDKTMIMLDTFSLDMHICLEHLSSKLHQLQMIVRYTPSAI